jgi:hypothetical protein
MNEILLNAILYDYCSLMMLKIYKITMKNNVFN